MAEDKDGASPYRSYGRSMCEAAAEPWPLACFIRVPSVFHPWLSIPHWLEPRHLCRYVAVKIPNPFRAREVQMSHGEKFSFRRCSGESGLGKRNARVTSFCILFLVNL